jgi:hypothetical protein
MVLKKNLDVFAFMPTCAVHIKPDLVSSQLPAKIAQTQKKSFSIPLGMPNQPRFSQERRNPAKDIQPRLMLLVVGIRNRRPRLAQPMPKRGWSVKPVSSSNTTVSFDPRLLSFF